MNEDDEALHKNHVSRNRPLRVVATCGVVDCPSTLWCRRNRRSVSFQPLADTFILKQNTSYNVS
jgi:hypothetical protein